MLYRNLQWVIVYIYIYNIQTSAEEVVKSVKSKHGYKNTRSSKSMSTKLCYRCQTIQISGLCCSGEWNCWRKVARSGLRARHLLVNGLEKFSLVLPDSGVVHLPHQFSVLVDEPRLPENVRSCVFHLRVQKQNCLRLQWNKASMTPCSAFTYSFG